MSQAFDDALAATRETYGKVASMIVLLTAYHDYVLTHAEDPVALKAWVAEAQAKTAEVQAALDANPLPGEPPPVAGGAAAQAQATADRAAAKAQQAKGFPGR